MSVLDRLTKRCEWDPKELTINYFALRILLQKQFKMQFRESSALPNDCDICGNSLYATQVVQTRCGCTMHEACLMNGILCFNYTTCLVCRKEITSPQKGG